MAEKKDEKKTYYLGTGRRKSAVARVRVSEGKGAIVINGRTLENYFTEDKDRGAVVGPMLVTEMLNRVDVTIKVHGGGITGQAGAICQGLARAIKTMFTPASERKSVTFKNTTMIKARNLQVKVTATPVDAPPPVIDEAFGMVKKLRESGYLTRDSRMKERKKYGLRGARRGTQFSKR